MSSLTTLIQLILVTVLARGCYLFCLHPLARFPGPTLAVFTNLWKTITFFGGKNHLVEQKLHDELGSVVRTGPNSLSFSSLAAFEAIYGYNKSIEKGDFYSFGRDPKTQLSSIFSARTDASHRDHRKKVVGPAFSTSKVASYEPVVEKHVAILHTRIADATGLQTKSRGLNIAPLIHCFSFDTLNEIIYGEASQPYTDLKASSGILEDLKLISKMSWGCSLLPWLGWLMSTETMKTLTRKPKYDKDGDMIGIGALGARMNKLIFTKPEQALQSSSPSILQHWMQVSEGSSTKMSSDEMFRESFNLNFAGPGSSSAGLTSVLMELGTQDGQQWQQQIRAELKEGQTPSSSPTLTAVIKETLRLHAPFPTSFPRTIAPGGEEVLAQIIGSLPIGTIISANPYVLGQSKEIWGDDARVWQPQRWLGQGDIKELNDRFVVFSKGPRVCIGRDIVMLMMASTVASLLRKYEIRFDGQVKAQNFLEMQYELCGIELREINA